MSDPGSGGTDSATVWRAADAMVAATPLDFSAGVVAALHAARRLLNPVGTGWVIAPDPTVSQVTVTSLDDYLTEPQELTVSWQFSGRRQPAPAGPGALAMPGGKPGADAAATEFTGLAVLRWVGTGPQDWPWRITSAYTARDSA